MDYSSFLITSFKKVVQALDANQVDFAVCGGMAYSILVSPRGDDRLRLPDHGPSQYAYGNYSDIGTAV